jgi:hypothetical protein
MTRQGWTILTLSSTTKANYPQRKMVKLLNKAQDHEKGMQLFFAMIGRTRLEFRT